jgi:hypothetical protein
MFANDLLTESFIKACSVNDKQLVVELMNCSLKDNKYAITRGLIVALDYRNAEIYEYIFSTGFLNELDYVNSNVIIKRFSKDWDCLKLLEDNGLSFHTENNEPNYLITAFSEMDSLYNNGKNEVCQLILNGSNITQIKNFITHVIENDCLIEEEAKQTIILLDYMNNFDLKTINKLIKKCESYFDENILSINYDIIKHNSTCFLHRLNKVKMYKKLNNDLSKNNIIKSKNKI